MTQFVERPPFRADHVGSLLRPPRLKDARQAREAGRIPAEELARIEDEEIARIVRQQRDIGLSAVTDGEFRRAWWHFDFLEGLDGVEPYTAQQGIQFHQVQTRARGIRVAGRIDFTDHPMLAHFRYLKSVAGDAMAKMTIPSPNMLHFRGELNPRVYPDEDEFFADLAAAYRKAVRAFHAAGCRYLQLDDTSWAYLCSEEQRAQLRAKGWDPDRLAHRYARTLQEALAGRPEDLTVTMHICRGNFRSTWIASGGYEPVAEVLFTQVPVDGFFLEYDSDRAGGFEPLRFVERPDLRIVLGLVTSKFGELEKADDLKRRIDEATRFVPLEQLCLSPQCGFASTEEGNLLTEDDQWRKLELVVRVAGSVWGW
ncbi:5-methyltetrahydropteroyltriglutamate--homocysteine S-methyltransferase [Alicyclobacillus sp.]|uniref:5-methyltetrahydropteroyltriglutamate-- homocysteine S-methyltransferase n=1 Tax=Alicyclobacillus sp. TaxID=61169 RepID=UPI0025B9C43A|nr:5-methyltetrahydropteroyltriglutamate--homocysteine S-methyltransferase [Alicyclobacillus sp.]MCL6517287.1 5-methyltetrahydropteroyltriglutamate--homocysteine S-methyltransferase [Alicyclobacillus sp.]